MKKLSAIFVTLLSIQISAQHEKIFEMTNFQIDALLTETSEKNLNITDRMELFSSLFLEMPYNLTCSGDGPYALYETEPLVNFKETNCMVYCEHVLALSISDSWDNFFNNLQQIRYKNGIIGMRTRNHYTMADWLPENDWILEDVSRVIAGEGTKKVTREISHKSFFEGKGISDLRYIKPDRRVTIDYISFETLKEVKKRIKHGDIFALLFAKLENIFSAHMLMTYWIDGELVVRESAMSRKTTFDTPFDEWVEKYIKSERYLGVAFMRVKDELNTPGKVILPWEISELK